MIKLWKRTVRNCNCEKNEIVKLCLRADYNIKLGHKKVIDREIV